MTDVGGFAVGAGAAVPAPVPESIAALDRRVRVQGGETCRIGDLRDTPCLVLLGGPGTGKSAVLADEAARAGVPRTTVRHALYPSFVPGNVVMLDALDEFRTDGAPAERLDRLAHRLDSARPERCVLACRSDDWRGEADLDALRPLWRTPVVAELLPLEREEAGAILGALGDPDPGLLLDAAERGGADALLTTPLSVRLLHRVAAGGGKLPAGRLALFERACDVLAREHDAGRRSGPSLPVPDLLDAAGTVCLSLLLRGVDALERHGDPFAVLDDGVDAPLFVDQVPADPGRVRAALATALFHGDADRVAPMHRSIAEFLAARVLCRRALAPVDAVQAARLPGLISGPDGRAPSTLRATFAWLAAHFGAAGQGGWTAKLVRMDPIGVLLDGDVAALDDDAALLLLRSLATSDDPYFRLGHVATNLFGGLVRAPHAAEIATLIERPDESHLRLTLFDALAHGPPLPELVPSAERLVLDVDAELWVRERAAETVARCAPDPAAERVRLRVALARQPADLARACTGLALALTAPDAELDDAEVLRLLSDYERCPSGADFGRLWPLQQRLSGRSVASLFAAVRPGWRASSLLAGRGDELDELFGAVVDTAVAEQAGLRARTLWDWIAAALDAPERAVPRRLAAAARRWIGEDERRRREMGVAIARAETGFGQRFPSRVHDILEERPSPDLVDGLAVELDTCAPGVERRRLVASLVAAAAGIDGQSSRRRVWAGVLERTGERVAAATVGRAKRFAARAIPTQAVQTSFGETGSRPGVAPGHADRPLPGKRRGNPRGGAPRPGRPGRSAERNRVGAMARRPLGGSR